MTPHAPGQLQSLHLGRVTDSVDPDSRGRLKVLILALEMEVWASVATASAGSGYGIACLPKVDEVVVLAFITPEMPLVLGSIWSGSTSAPTEADPVEDNYVMRTPGGSVIRMDDGSDGPRILLSTPAGYEIQITDSSGGEITITKGSERISLGTAEISIESSGTVSVNAGGQVEINASMVQVNAGMTKFSGAIQADCVMTNSVVGVSYTTGAGCIW